MPDEERRSPAGRSDRPLTEVEVADILRRASAAEARAPFPVPQSPTLDELVEAAVDAGFEPAGVRRAAEVRCVREGSLSEVLFGAEERVRVTTRVRAPMPSQRYALVRAAEDALGGMGEVVTSDPEQLVWKSTRTLAHDTMIVRDEVSETSIEVRSDRMGRYLAFWGATFVLLGALSSSVEGFLALGAANPLLVFVLPAFLPVILARPFWRRSQRRTRNGVERLVMELARLVEKDPAAPGRSGADGAPGT